MPSKIHKPSLPASTTKLVCFSSTLKFPKAAQRYTHAQRQQRPRSDSKNVPVAGLNREVTCGDVDLLTRAGQVALRFFFSAGL